MTVPAYTHEEFIATVMARLVRGLRHIAVGALSPVPATAALLARETTHRRHWSLFSAVRSICRLPTAVANFSIVRRRDASMRFS